MPFRHSVAPSPQDIESIAKQVLHDLPEMFSSRLSGLVIRVEEFPDDETLDELGVESPFDLMGLYRGVDLTRKSVLDTPDDLDAVILYRRPILDYWCDADCEDTLEQIVAHVLIHEIGHHFGFTDEDMEAIERK